LLRKGYRGTSPDPATAGNRSIVTAYGRTIRRNGKKGAKTADRGRAKDRVSAKRGGYLFAAKQLAKVAMGGPKLIGLV